MKNVFNFEKFVKVNEMFSGDLNDLNFNLLKENNLGLELNEVSKADFKPSKTMVAWAIGGKSTGANGFIKFATAVAQNWDELEDAEKEKFAEKWSQMKGKFKKEKAKVTQKANSGDGKSKVELEDVSYSKRNEVDKLYTSKIEPLYKDSGEKSKAADPDKIKAQIEDLKDEKKKLDAERKKQIEIRDDKGFSSDEGKAAQQQISKLVGQIDGIDAKIDTLEGQIEDEED